MKYKAEEGFDEREYDRNRKEDQERAKKQREEEMSEEERAKRRIEDEIELTRQMMFRRNPVWQSANNHFNYENRKEHENRKQKELEELFPNGVKAFNGILKWLSKF